MTRVRSSGNRASRAFARATVMLAALAPMLVLVAAHAGAAPRTWRQAFAGEADSVLFIGASGEVLVAPFDLTATRTLWAPGGNERLSRLRTSPDGQRAAWITTSEEADSSRLWTGLPGRAVARARFRPLRPGRFGVLRFEPEGPTTEDPAFEGARLVEPNMMQRRRVTHPLEWTPDGSSVVFGTAEALVLASGDLDRAYEVSAHLVERLVGLDPSSIFLAQILRPGAGGVREEWTLFYPAPGHWRAFQAAGLEPTVPWTASTSTVWWANDTSIRSVRVHDPEPVPEFETQEPVKWIQHDAARQTLIWLAGPRLEDRPEDGGTISPRRLFGAPPSAILKTSGDGPVAFVIAESLVVWSLGDSLFKGFELDGFAPTRLIAPRHHSLHVLGRVGKRWTLGRLDPRALVRIDLPDLKDPLAFPSPSGHRLVVWESGTRAPGTLHVLDLRTGEWSEVRNPGVIGWEPLVPR